MCLVSKKFDRILSFYVVNKMGDRTYIRLRKTGQFLRQATKLSRIEDFYETVLAFWEQRKANPRSAE
jgi:hypothetical protein